MVFPYYKKTRPMLSFLGKPIFQAAYFAEIGRHSFGSAL